MRVPFDKMGRACSVPGCTTNYRSNTEGGISTFAFPRDKEERDKWIRAIRRVDFNPGKHACVCIRHFPENNIIRVHTAKRPDGSVLIVPRGHPKLTNDALPTIFPGHPSFTSQPKSARRKKVPEERKENILQKDGLIKTCCEEDKILNDDLLGVPPVNNHKPIKKLKRGAVSSQILSDRTLRPKAKRRKRRNPGARKLNISVETVWLPGEGNSVNTVRQDSMESGDCPVFFQEIEEPEEIVFKTEQLTEGAKEENEGNPLFETTGEPEAVVVKTEPFTEENTQDEQSPLPVDDALELRMKEEPEDNTVQTESVTERNMETIIVKEEITFEEPDVHIEESSAENECSEW